MKIHFRSLTALILITGFVAHAIADDLHPPPWARGSDRTTTQEWTFDSTTDINGHPINGFGNPYGNPVVTNPSSFVWLPDDSSFNPTNPNPRHGIVTLAPGSTLKFLIPNHEDLAYQKLVWAQLTWWADPGNDVVISPLAQDPNTGATVGTIPLGAGWNHTTLSFVLAQQPAFEEFWVQNFTNDNLYLDQVVIDTKCVPEPASLAVLALGGFGLLLRRKRS